MGDLIDLAVVRATRERQRLAAKIQETRPLDFYFPSIPNVTIGSACNPPTHMWMPFALRCYCGQQVRKKETT